MECTKEKFFPRDPVRLTIMYQLQRLCNMEDVWQQADVTYFKIGPRNCSALSESPLAFRTAI